MPLFLLFGFYSLLTQVLLLREISQVFTAHELSLAAGLSSWVLWTAAGARLGARPARSRRNFTAGAVIFAAIAPANLLLARLAPGFRPGLSQPGLFTMLAGSFLLAMPSGLANGLAAGAALPGRPAGFYAAEAAGAAAAGLFTIFYFHYFPGLQAVAALAAPGLALCLVYAAQKPFRPARLAAAAAVFAVYGMADRAAPLCWTLKPPSPRPELVVQTEGSRLAVTGRRDLSFYEDGRLLHAAQDTAPEEFAQIPMLALKKPGRALLTGSGAFFILPEILKHRPAAVDIAEPDGFKAEALANATRADKRTFTLIPKDPRRLKNRGAAYDIIFQTASSPENAALNRYFTLEYFRGAGAMLKPGGMLVFQLPFAENYVPKEAAYAAACVLASARAVFPYLEFIPGERLTVMASVQKLELEPEVLAAAYAARGIKDKTVVPSALPFLLDPGRRAWAENEIARVKDPPRNTDLDPLAYFRFWRAWSSMVADPSSLVGLLALMGAALLAASKLRKVIKFVPGNRGGEAFLMGFWAMSFETALLLAFQSETGRLSPELGLLFAVFMAGGAAGAWAGRKGASGIWTAELAAAAMALGCAAAPAIFSGGAEIWLLMAGAGTVTGFFFARAAGGDPAGIYALDLAGGAAGGLVTAAFSAPLGGIGGALAISGASALCALAGGLFATNRKLNARPCGRSTINKKRLYFSTQNPFISFNKPEERNRRSFCGGVTRGCPGAA